MDSLEAVRLITGTSVDDQISVAVARLALMVAMTGSALALLVASVLHGFRVSDDFIALTSCWLVSFVADLFELKAGWIESLLFGLFGLIFFAA